MIRNFLSLKREEVKISKEQLNKNYLTINYSDLHIKHLNESFSFRNNNDIYIYVCIGQNFVLADLYITDTLT